ncbi:MAG TPA: hypothetical protein PLE54_06415 [Burkholderiaceae bacterium]|nr:hypothetical protein [Burkholderiaceae bacterium]HQR70217.1 hypothetical protein [Burkholderiaceae bacterium]
MQYLAVTAAPRLAGSDAGMRPVATRVAHGARPIPLELRRRADRPGTGALEVGRVHSGGTWSDADVHREIASALDPEWAPALRARLEWYMCRGAFFHTDAHFGDVLFGVWYVSGPPVDMVFPLAGLCLAVEPGALVVFDPFEVHGVLRRGAERYCAGDYADAAASVFIGFEVDLTDSVRDRFGMGAYFADARVVSSATRVSATTGMID